MKINSFPKKKFFSKKTIVQQFRVSCHIYIYQQSTFNIHIYYVNIPGNEADAPPQHSKTLPSHGD